MVSSSSIVAARRSFDHAMSILQTDPASARRLFREACETDPTMADAWLGRIAAGEPQRFIAKGF